MQVKLHLQDAWSFEYFESTWLLRKHIFQEEIYMSDGNAWTPAPK